MHGASRCATRRASGWWWCCCTGWARWSGSPTSGADELPRVEVAFATPDEQVLLAIDVPEGTTLRDAVTRSGIAARFPGHDLAAMPLGVFGRLRADSDV